MENLKILGGKSFSVKNGVPVELNLSARAILLMFVSHWLKDIKDPVIITQTQIAEGVGVEYRTVMRCMKELVAHGLILCIKQKARAMGYIGFSYYGHPDIYVDGELLIKESMVDDEAIERAAAGYDPKNPNRYYVYVCTHNEVPVYVGKGINNRDSHCLSGKSTSAGLNKLVWSGESANMQVKRIFNQLSSDEAAQKERTLIDGFKNLGYSLSNMQ